MVYLSKSKYCGLWQFPKIAWMKKYKPEEQKIARHHLLKYCELDTYAMVMRTRPFKVSTKTKH